MRLVSAAATGRGKVRENNEDAHFADDARGVYAVADGMGGHAAGEVASGIAVGHARRLSGARTIDRALMAGAFADAHRSIMARGSALPECRGMGTTLTALVLRGDRALIGHAGDSRCYLIRDKTCSQLTTDHHVYGHMLSNCLGARESAFQGADVVGVLAHPDDLFVLCTDGLSRYLDAVAIWEVVCVAFGRREPAAQALVDRALAAGGEDNVTAVVVGVLEI